MKTSSGTRRGKVASGILCLTILCVIGFVDYEIDYRVSFTVLYVLPIGFATLYINRAFAIFLGALSVAFWIGGDFFAGAPSPGPAIQAWNAGIVFLLYAIVIYLLDKLSRVLVGLEATVANRTVALRREMEERRRLQHEILDLTERERQAFGYELHDVVCQELAGTAIAGHMLVKKLEAKQMTEAADAREIAALIDHALSKTRSVAREFFTTGFDEVGLAESLRQTVRNVEERSGVKCEIKWEEDVVILNEEAVVHLFRIAQEAIQNAVKHAGSTQIHVSLARQDKAVRLEIHDNGKGIELSKKPQKGLGLKIMAYRAGVIGGEFKIENPSNGGTRIICEIPEERAPRNWRQLR